jgi:hypothetical protein
VARACCGYSLVHMDLNSTLSAGSLLVGCIQAWAAISQPSSAASPKAPYMRPLLILGAFGALFSRSTYSKINRSIVRRQSMWRKRGRVLCPRQLAAVISRVAAMTARMLQGRGTPLVHLHPDNLTLKIGVLLIGLVLRSAPAQQGRTGELKTSGTCNQISTDSQNTFILNCTVQGTDGNRVATLERAIGRQPTSQ